MLSRQLSKITNSARAVLLKKYQFRQICSPCSSRCPCNVYPSARNVSTTTTLLKEVGKNDAQNKVNSTFKKSKLKMENRPGKIESKNKVHTSATNKQQLKMANLTDISEPQNKMNASASFQNRNSEIIENKQKLEEKLNKSQDEIIEKFITGLSTDMHLKKRVYKNDLQRAISKVQELNFSTRKQGLLLIHCCTEFLADEAPATRMDLSDQVWNALKPHTKFDVEHYNALLRVYIANKMTVIASVFITKMQPVKPNMTTYELLLKALSEAGDLNQATEVISNMKAQGLPATEDMFNSLIYCQGRSGHPNNIQEILSMMDSLKVPRTTDTYAAVVRALAYNKLRAKLLKEMDRVYNSGVQFQETHIMAIVKTLAEVALDDIIPKVLAYLPREILTNPSITPYMQIVSTQLVFQNFPMAALEIYKCLPLPAFGPRDDQGLHGRSLVRDCVKAAIPSSVIALIAQDLMASGRNPIALQNACEAALQLGKVPLTLDIFTRMKMIGLPIRCHYFWPILLQSSKSYGEKGIMNTIRTMVSMEVTPDYETFMDYVLPYVSFTSPQNLMKKFLEAGLTASVVLTPMMETLLNSGQVRAASEICELFQGKIDSDKLVKPLVKGYLISMDLKSTLHILEDVSKKASDQTKDWVGRFLCHFISHKKIKGDLQEFFIIVNSIKDTKLKISTSATDYCIAHFPETCDKENPKTFKDILIQITDELLVDESDMFTHQMPHPKRMGEESLRAHLNELEAKGMNTRGVLRKLLQEYCRVGNLPAAREIVEKCQKEKVFLSAGMKAAIFDLHVKLGELDQAEIILAELSKTAPNFLLDEYKVIDFATLMVYQKRIDRAFAMINEQSKKRHVVGGRNISMNCWRLLDAVAANNSPVETRNMFELLTSLRYCQPSNSILGPLIRVHLKYENLEEAVKEFTRIANKYNKTPLKHELLCKILQNMNDGLCEEKFLSNEKCNGRLNRLAQTILNINKNVHGSSDVQLTLIAALAEVGYTKTIRKMLLDPSIQIHSNALYRRCERFADEHKVQPLEAIAECARDIRHIDVADIYDLILDVHHRDDDVDKALQLYAKMQDQEITPSQKFVRTLCSMAKANNKPIPSEIVALVDKIKVANT